MTTKTNLRKLLEPRQTFASNTEKVDFGSIEPMRRPDLDPKRDLPQPSYRPGALDFMAVPSRGFA